MKTSNYNLDSCSNNPLLLAVTYIDNGLHIVLCQTLKKCSQRSQIMQLGVIAVFVLTTVALLLMSSVLVKVYAQTPQIEQSKPIKCQTGALIGYGGTIFGLADVCTNGNLIDVDLTTNYIPQPGKVFEAWLVDDFQRVQTTH